MCYPSLKCWSRINKNFELHCNSREIFSSGLLRADTMTLKICCVCDIDLLKVVKNNCLNAKKEIKNKLWIIESISLIINDMSIFFRLNIFKWLIEISEVTWPQIFQSTIWIYLQHYSLVVLRKWKYFLEI